MGHNGLSHGGTVEVKRAPRGRVVDGSLYGHRMFSSRDVLQWLTAGLGAVLVLSLVGVTFSALGLHSTAITITWVSLVIAVLIGVPALVLVAVDARRALLERRRARSIS